ncbi:hypothetical protein J4Q44_G00198130, partial [Coregonus suidteri]
PNKNICFVQDRSLHRPVRYSQSELQKAFIQKKQFATLPSFTLNWTVCLQAVATARLGSLERIRQKPQNTPEWIEICKHHRSPLTFGNFTVLLIKQL